MHYLHYSSSQTVVDRLNNMIQSRLFALEPQNDQERHRKPVSPSCRATPQTSMLAPPPLVTVSLQLHWLFRILSENSPGVLATTLETVLNIFNVY